MSQRAANGRKCKSLNVTKTLQTELQALIVYACYDSNELRDSGVTMRKPKLTETLFDLYMPPDDTNNDRLGMVELFLSGSGKFKGLFNCLDSGETGDRLIIPPLFHCLDGKEIALDKKCISLSLLTRKNLTNSADIKPDRLYVHVTDLNNNFKKAMRLCLSDDNPYKNVPSSGNFPSGHNWEDYVKWLRVAMHRSLEEEENRRKINLLSDDDMSNENGGGKKSDDLDGDDGGKGKEVVDKGDGDDDSELIQNNGDDDDEEASNAHDVPTDTYFKGFFAFALWGYIPPPGYEEYQSMLIKTILNHPDVVGKGAGKKLSRISCRKQESKKG